MSKVTVIPSTINPVTHLPKFTYHKRKVCAYARVSTLQDEQTSSYEAQVDYYTRYIKSKPEWEFVGIYTDEGISGTNTKKRDGFNNMINDAMDNKIDLIITKSVSRFARNTVDSLSTIRKLKDAGIEVYFEKENIYTLDSKGELLLAIISSIAQEESRSISENVKWGIRKKLQDGQVTLPYSAFLGYDKGEDNSIVINEEEAKIVRTIYESFLKGETYTSIKDIVEKKGYKSPKGNEKWSTSTIKSILRNEKYKGDALLQKTYVKDFLEHKMVKNNGEVPQYYVESHHEPIIDPHEWDLVQEEIKRRNELNHVYSSKTCFSSKLVCADCGAIYGQKLWHSNDKYRKLVYRCNDKFNKSHAKCLTPTLMEEDIKCAFIKAYNEFVLDKDTIIKDTEEMIKVLDNTKELNEKISAIQKEIEEVGKSVKKLIEENATRKIEQSKFLSDYENLDHRNNELISELEKSEAELKSNVTKKKEMEAFVKGIKDKAEVVTAYDKELLIYFIDKMVVNRNNTITFIFKNGIKKVVTI